MAAADQILDALAWASLTEQARVARISSSLVKELTSVSRGHTQTAVKNAVKRTNPPFGRGKFIIAAVEKEYRRQRPIWEARKGRHEELQTYLRRMAKLSTRLNQAYAAAFDRPPYLPRQPWTGGYDYDARNAFNEKESLRDKGDICYAITHQDGYVVALVVIDDGYQRRYELATRYKRGPITRTCFRSGDRLIGDFVSAIVSLGGPKVKAALAKGKKVVTDWVGGRTFIHHEGQDHYHARIEELPWLVSVYVDRPNWRGALELTAVSAIRHGDTTTVV